MQVCLMWRFAGESERKRERGRETLARPALGRRGLWGGSCFIRAVQSSHYSPITILPLPDQLNGQTGALGPLPSSCTSTHAWSHMHARVHTGYVNM